MASIETGGNLYLIELWDKNERFFKIGITVHRYCRFYEIMKSGYSVRIIYMLFRLDYLTALKAESYLQSIFESYTPLKCFGGHTECFSGIDIDEYKKFTNTLFPDCNEITQNLEITWR